MITSDKEAFSAFKDHSAVYILMKDFIFSNSALETGEVYGYWGISV